jgi:hypothetical protein
VVKVFKGVDATAGSSGGALGGQLAACSETSAADLAVGVAERRLPPATKLQGAVGGVELVACRRRGRALGVDHDAIWQRHVGDDPQHRAGGVRPRASVGDLRSWKSRW